MDSGGDWLLSRVMRERAREDPDVRGRGVGVTTPSGSSGQLNASGGSGVECT